MAATFARAAFGRFGAGVPGGLKTAGLGVGAACALGLPFAKAHAQESVPPFTMATTRYDQSSYVGRLYTIFAKIDPATLLISDAEVLRCKALIDEYNKAQTIPTGQTDADMWRARSLVDGIIHPVTKEPMFVLGRMSCFVPMNAPICALMLNAHTMPAVVFSQWLNQSYNVLNNYVNRSSLEVDWAGLMKPYSVAVLVSCSIALGARQAIASLPSLAKLGLFVPYLAVISAGSCNVALTRMDEWAGRGVCIYSPEGKELGMSVKAGQQAVMKTICTRSICLPIPLLLVPPVVMSAVPLTGIARVGVEMCVILSCLSCALPCALAILPQEMVVPAAGLEPEYQNLKDISGKPITEVFANKGL